MDWNTLGELGQNPVCQSLTAGALAACFAVLAGYLLCGPRRRTAADPGPQIDAAFGLDRLNARAGGHGR